MTQRAITTNQVKDATSSVPLVNTIATVYAQANAANITGQTAFSLANTANNTANGAYFQANLAYGQANLAFPANGSSNIANANVTGILYHANGNSTNPSMTFTANSKTGFSLTSSDTITISTNGNSSLILSQTAMNVFPILNTNSAVITGTLFLAAGSNVSSPYGNANSVPLKFVFPGTGIFGIPSPIGVGIAVGSNGVAAFSQTAITLGNTSANIPVSVPGDLTISGNTNVTSNITATGQLIANGTTAGDNAPSGAIGEYMEAIVATASGTSLSNVTPSTVTGLTLTLTPGDWDVEGLAVFSGTGTVVQYIETGLSAALNTLPATQYISIWLGRASALPASQTINLMRRRYNVTTTTTVYVAAQASWSGTGTVVASGYISARRMR